MSPSIPRSLQNILSHQPKLPKGIFHDYLTKRQLPEVGLLNPLLQLTAGVGFIRNVSQRLQNRQRFAAKYFTPAQQKTYDSAQYSFYLGYLVHLITDVLWVRDIYDPSKIRFSEERARDPEGFIWKLKEDWYDLDYKYLRDHPGFRAFRVYLGAVGFVNSYMEEFAPDAFDNRRQYITGFYLQENDHLDREYPYLSEAEMDAFVENSVREFPCLLKEYCAAQDAAAL